MRRIDDDLMESRGGQREGVNTIFYWIIFLLLLVAFAATCWLGSIYIFGHPEKPIGYKFLTKAHKLDLPKRFELTMAPKGEFLTANKILARYGGLTDAELSMANDTLLRNYLRNYKQVTELVPYVSGTYTILDSYELTSGDIFQSGVVALTQSTENPQLLLEQIFPTQKSTVLILQRALLTGTPIPLLRSLSLSTILHVQKMPDGRLKVTTLPLDYPTYMAGQSSSSFSLEPPTVINIEAGLPVMNKERVAEADERYAAYRHKAGLDKTEKPGTPPQHSALSLVRVETAIPVDETKIPVKKAEAVQKPTLQHLAPAIALGTPVPAPQPSPTPAPTAPAVAATSSSSESMTGQEAPTATPAPAIQNANSKTWPIYPPGKMPRGRLLNSGDIAELAEKGISDERVYLQGNFLVTASGNNRAVLRSQGGLGFIGHSANTRIIVDFPQGDKPPSEGSQFSRDSRRPFMISEVRKGADGYTNVYVREITSQP
ncbi:MAG: hypothetical protein ABI443_11720 [Chthoniobacterales bacterium]